MIFLIVKHLNSGMSLVLVLLFFLFKEAGDKLFSKAVIHCVHKKRPPEHV